MTRHTLVTVATAALAAVSVAAALVAAPRDPASRPTEDEIRAIARTAFSRAVDADGLARFEQALAARLPGYTSVPIQAFRTDALSVSVTGPVVAFYRDASDAVTRHQPLGGLQWTPGVAVAVVPLTLASPDVVSLIVTRDGKRVAPVTSALVPHELQTPSGSVMLHIGEIVFPSEAFDAGATVTVTIVMSGPRVTRVLSPDELARIH